MSLSPPPVTEQVVDSKGVPTLPWTLFFDQSFRGDTGTAWTPTFVSLGISGTPSITGRYYQISRQLVYFTIHIVPASNTSATAGTTYCDNFPLAVTRNGVCASVSGNLGGALGVVQEGSSRIYVPSWSSVSVPVTIIGIAEAR